MCQASKARNRKRTSDRPSEPLSLTLFCSLACLPLDPSVAETATANEKKRAPQDKGKQPKPESEGEEEEGAEEGEEEEEGVKGFWCEADRKKGSDGSSSRRG